MTDDDYIAADTAELTLSASDEATGSSLEANAVDGSVFSAPILDPIRACD